MYATLIFSLLNIIVMYLLHYFYLCVLFMYLLHHFTCVLYINHYVFIDLYIESRRLATILMLMLLVLQCTDYK